MECQQGFVAVAHVPFWCFQASKMSCANATLGFSSSKAASILGRLAATQRGKGVRMDG